MNMYLQNVHMYTCLHSRLVMRPMRRIGLGGQWKYWPFVASILTSMITMTSTMKSSEYHSRSSTHKTFGESDITESQDHFHHYLIQHRAKRDSETGKRVFSGFGDIAPVSLLEGSCLANKVLFFN